MLHSVFRRNTKDGIRLVASIQLLSQDANLITQSNLDPSSSSALIHHIHYDQPFSLKQFNPNGSPSTTPPRRNHTFHCHHRYYATTNTTVPSPTGTWIDHLPRSWIPYAQLSRLDKPIGTWLLAWPCFWSISLAAAPGHFPDLPTLSLFGLGAILLRGAGCTINDLWDQDLDKKVERTKTRPLPAGLVTTQHALGWLAAQLTAGLGVLLQLNPYSQALGASSLALVATYPLMKRFTGWPQAFLGLTFNWGALLGWAAVRGTCDWSIVLPLYAGGVFWTLVYDTIYAHQDKADDVAAGIKSTALTFGEHNKKYLSLFAAANVGSMALAGHVAGCGVPYSIGLGLAGTHMLWQIYSVDLDDAKQCGDAFRRTWWYGALVYGGITIDRVLG